jgi:hypothetical protein
MDNKELAQLISSILKNPSTPQPLKDTIHDSLSFMSQFADDESPEMIEMFLNGYEEKGNGETIEISRDKDGISVIG